ncbi:MAG: hypothetical protein HZC41_08415 [Chloroflexi bacterium]|nr:hypothetical protein [Chloroflexota bacterium]
MTERVGDLEIGQDLEFQRRAWAVQRVAWIGMLLFIIAALLGLLGDSGPLSNATAGSEADGLQIQYHRFMRQGKPMSLTVQAEVPAGQNTLRLRVNRAYLDRFQLDQITPDPESVAARDGQLVYEFALENPAGQVTIKFNMRPEQGGFVTGEIGLDGSETLSINQFIYP